MGRREFHDSRRRHADDDSDGGNRRRRNSRSRSRSRDYRKRDRESSYDDNRGHRNRRTEDAPRRRDNSRESRQFRGNALQPSRRVYHPPESTVRVGNADVAPSCATPIPILAPTSQVVLSGVDRSVNSGHIRSMLSVLGFSDAISRVDIKAFWAPPVQSFHVDMKRVEDAAKVATLMHGGWINGNQVHATHVVTRS